MIPLKREYLLTTLRTPLLFIAGACRNFTRHGNKRRERQIGKVTLFVEYNRKKQNMVNSGCFLFSWYSFRRGTEASHMLCIAIQLACVPASSTRETLPPPVYSTSKDIDNNGMPS